MKGKREWRGEKEREGKGLEEQEMTPNEREENIDILKEETVRDKIKKKRIKSTGKS